jgi:hypothetical protein
MYRLFSLAFVLRCDGKYYLGDDNPARWGTLEAACLYPEGPAAQKHKELANGKDCEILCLIQDKHFNFHDGEKFAYAMGEAKLYTPEQGRLLLRRLHEDAAKN